jgi:CHAT domain-containing protein
VPDGVLHGLSFAALRRAEAEGPGAYLAAWRPTAVAPSLTALAQLAGRPARALPRRTAVIVGDVDFGEAPAATGTSDERLRGAAIEGLLPLPGTRREAEDVARTFPARSTLLLGAAASEQAVKRVARDTSILHLATHGIVNERTPLDSALVLAAPGVDDSDNGLLQAWEIFDQVRVDADLVVLSACDTGLGRTFAGEGLLGLTRAFQFAGARAVAASLWKAPDEATAALMGAFYAELARGSGADVALARAEQQLLSRPETAHPFYWAAFVIDGDTRP